jgi:hypothetical protein
VPGGRAGPQQSRGASPRGAGAGGESPGWAGQAGGPGTKKKKNMEALRKNCHMDAKRQQEN